MQMVTEACNAGVLQHVQSEACIRLFLLMCVNVSFDYYNVNALLLDCKSNYINSWYFKLCVNDILVNQGAFSFLHRVVSWKK